MLLARVLHVSVAHTVVLVDTTLGGEARHDGARVGDVVVTVVFRSVGVNLGQSGIVEHGGQLVAGRTRDVEEATAVVHDLVAVAAAELQAQVEVLIGEGVAKAPCELRLRVANEGLVVVVDDTVTVEVERWVLGVGCWVLGVSSHLVPRTSYLDR